MLLLIQQWLLQLFLGPLLVLLWYDRNCGPDANTRVQSLVDILLMFLQLRIPLLLLLSTLRLMFAVIAIVVANVAAAVATLVVVGDDTYPAVFPK